MKVLLIDDDVDDQEIFSMAIEDSRSEAECIFAKDGIHALEQIHGNPEFIPDFIFIDMNMPRMNGKECLIELKKIDRLRNVPIFMYSTSSDPFNKSENIKLGATGFIVKPSDIKDLTSILDELLIK